MLDVQHEVVTVGLEAASFYFFVAEPDTAAPNGMKQSFDWWLYCFARKMGGPTALEEGACIKSVYGRSIPAWCYQMCRPHRQCLDAPGKYCRSRLPGLLVACGLWPVIRMNICTRTYYRYRIVSLAMQNAVMSDSIQGMIQRHLGA